MCGTRRVHPAQHSSCVVQPAEPEQDAGKDAAVLVAQRRHVDPGDVGAGGIALLLVQPGGGAAQQDRVEEPSRVARRAAVGPDQALDLLDEPAELVPGLGPSALAAQTPGSLVPLPEIGIDLGPRAFAQALLVPLAVRRAAGVLVASTTREATPRVPPTR